MTGEAVAAADWTREVVGSDDFALLDAFLQSLVGVRCWKGRLSYGDELKLHFGEPHAADNLKSTDLRRGAWVLATRASAWRARMAHAGQNGTPPGLTMAAAVANQFAGAEVAAAGVSRWCPPDDAAPGLLLAFADGSTFEIGPGQAVDTDAADAEPLADWELFTPFNTYLRVGPGPVWSHLRSDAPAPPR